MRERQVQMALGRGLLLLVDPAALDIGDGLQTAAGQVRIKLIRGFERLGKLRAFNRQLRLMRGSAFNRRRRRGYFALDFQGGCRGAGHKTQGKQSAA